MGIANIINTSTSSGGGGGEIIRELVNSSDGQGLYFSNTGYIHLANNAAAEFGTSDFSIEFILNQTGEVGSSGGSIYQSATTVNNKFSIENHVSSNVVKLIFFNAVGAAAQYDLSYNMAADYNEPTHYVVSCDRSGNAVLYRNGTEVASVSIAASASTNLGDGVSSTAMIGNSGSGYTFLGGLYRFRTWNKALSHDEVDTCFQRADVPFADQYGSQTSKILNGTNWTGASGTTPPNSWTVGSGQVPNFTIDSSSGSGNEPALKFQRGANNMPFFFQTFTAEIGKKYRVAYRIKNIDAIHVRVGIGSSAVGTQYNVSDYTSTDWVDYADTFTATTTTFSVYVQANTVTGTQGGYIDSVVVEKVGVLTDHDLAFANPTQSSICQDRAGNSDGTMGGTIQQTQKIPQLNATAIAVSAATARTPADGDIIADKLGVGIAPTHAATIYGTGAGNATVQIEGEGGADPTINLLTNNTTHWALGVDDSDSDNFKICKHSAIGSTNNYLTIDTAGNVQIGSGTHTGGNLFIGDDSDTVFDASQGSHQRTDGATLDIHNDSTTVNSFSQIILRNRSSNVGGCRIASVSNGADSSDLAIVTGDTGEKMRISAAGNVTITGGADSITKVVGTSTGARLDLQTDSHHRFMQLVESDGRLRIYDQTAGVERLTVSSAGNVSVNAATPKAKLHVKATGTNWEDSLLLEKSSGNTGWNFLPGNSGNSDLWIGYNADTSASLTSQSATTALAISSAGQVEVASGNAHISSATQGSLNFGNISTNTYAKLEYDDTNGNFNIANTRAYPLRFLTNNTEWLRINSGGNVLIGATAVPSASVEGFCITGTNSGNISSSGSATTAYNHVMFFNGNGNVGNISTSGSATTYATSSDYRLKENLEPLTNALDRIEQLPVYRFNFKADPEKTVDGFVAHEAQAIVPESVTGEKDAMQTVVVQEAVEAVEYQPAIEAVEYQPATYYEEGDDLPEGVQVGDVKTEEIQAVEGQPEIQAVEAQEEVTEEQPLYQGIDQSKLVPLLVAAIKELKAKVEALENA